MPICRNPGKNLVSPSHKTTAHSRRLWLVAPLNLPATVAYDHFRYRAIASPGSIQGGDGNCRRLGGSRFWT